MLQLIKYLFIILSLLLLINASLVKVSVIVPVYNTSKFLNRSLESIINQTLKDIEIICVDDASKDNSYEILKEYEKKDNRIKVYQFKKNKGPSSARNKGMEMASGEFIHFFDSDDYADEKYLEYLYSFSSNYDVIEGTFVNSTNNSKNYYVNKLPQKSNGFLFDSLFRKSFIDKYNVTFPIKVRLQEDKIFRKKVYKYRPRIFKAPDNGIYYYYKQRRGSLWKKSKKHMEKVENRALKETEKRNKHMQL